MVHLADPPPLLTPPALPSPGQWWPPRMLDPEWITANSARFDVAHVQFGFEQVELETLARAFDRLRAARIPLVVTVHDLANPQLPSGPDGQKPHSERLDLLLGRADHIATLTRGAAAEIQKRWCREAQVIPHPAMIAPHRDRPLGARSTTMTVGTHLGDLRPNVAAVATVSAAIVAIDALRRQGIDCRLRVFLRRRVRDVATAERIAAMCDSDGSTELVRHDRLSDVDLYAQVADLDVCVLPYGHGTHSGWLELCFDLGVSVVSARVGYFAEQHPDAGFFTGAGAQLDAASLTYSASLTDAIGSRLSDPALPRAGSDLRGTVQARRRAEREAGDHAIRTAHSAMYMRAIDRMSS